MNKYLFFSLKTKFYLKTENFTMKIKKSDTRLHM